MIQPDLVRLSPNRSASIWLGWRAVMIHSTRSGIPGNDDWMSTLYWFSNPASGVSSHWLVGRDGRRARIVMDNRPAQHAGEHNPYTIGIELEQPTIDTPFTAEQLESAAELVRAYCADYMIPAEHILGLRNGQHGIIGHDESEQGREVGKSDPGPLFPWPSFMAMVRGEEEAMTAEERAELEALRRDVAEQQQWREVVAPLIDGLSAALGLLQVTHTGHRHSQRGKPPL